MKCAVVITQHPGDEFYALDAEDSVEAARAAGSGAFSEIVPIRIAAPNAGDAVEVHHQALHRAIDAQAEWIFFLDARDVLCIHAFTTVADKLGSYDALWGGIYEFAEDETRGMPREGQLAQITRIEDVLANAPSATLGSGHLVRTGSALLTALDPARGDGALFDYFLNLWRNFRCIKIAAPLVYERRTGDRAGAEQSAAIERVICRHCAALDFGAEFTYRGERFRFAVANPFDLIHASFLKGRFFEQPELNFIEDWVGKNAAIVEAGAYVGNHAVYYARFMQPRTVMVLEPNPESIALLRRNLDVNAVQCADLSHLGIGVAAHAGSYDLVCERESNRGATRLVAAERGAVAAAPLDQLIKDRIDFMKIDVEGMELEALAGAERVIGESRPKIMIEVLRPQIAQFEAWVDSHRYRVVRRFENVYAVNFCVEPAHG